MMEFRTTWTLMMTMTGFLTSVTNNNTEHFSFSLKEFSGNIESVFSFDPILTVKMIQLHFQTIQTSLDMESCEKNHGS